MNRRSFVGKVAAWAAGLFAAKKVLAEPEAPSWGDDFVARNAYIRGQWDVTPDCFCTGNRVRVTELWADGKVWREVVPYVPMNGECVRCMIRDATHTWNGEKWITETDLQRAYRAP